MAMRRMTSTLGRYGQESLRASSGFRQDARRRGGFARDELRRLPERGRARRAMRVKPAPCHGPLELVRRWTYERNRLRITASPGSRAGTRPDKPSVARVAREQHPAGLAAPTARSSGPSGEQQTTRRRTTMSAARPPRAPRRGRRPRTTSRSAIPTDRASSPARSFVLGHDARPCGRSPRRDERAPPGSDRSRRRSRRRWCRGGRPPRPTRRSASRRRRRARSPGTGAAHAARSSPRRCPAGRWRSTSRACRHRAGTTGPAARPEAQAQACGMRASRAAPSASRTGRSSIRSSTSWKKPRTISRSASERGRPRAIR